MQRSADPITIDHVIDLRRDIQRLEKDLDQYKQAYDKILTEQIKLIQELNNLRSTQQSEQSTIPYFGY